MVFCREVETLVKAVTDQMNGTVPELLGVVKHLASDRLRPGLPRSPLDMQRGNPKAYPWLPYGLWDNNVTKASGLDDVMVGSFQDNSRNQNPAKVLLCDIHIWCSI